MRLFRAAPPERPVRTLLRHLEDHEYEEALAALRHVTEDHPAPPPHALRHLGRWFLTRDPKSAILPFERFLALYEHHLDRAGVLRDLAQASAKAGKRRAAARYAEEAERLRVS